MQRHINIKHNKNGKSPITRRYIATGAVTFCTTFTVAYIASAGFMSPGSSDAATNVSASITSGSYFVNVTSLGEVNIDVNATQDGTVSTGNDIVTVNTNTKGYKLYLSTASNAASSDRMYLNGDTSSTYYLKPTSGDTGGSGSGSSGSGAGLDKNSWGYSINAGSSYSAVPVKGNEALIVDKWNALTAGTSTTNTHTVTYGVKADLSMPSGCYNNTVAYSVIAEANTVSNVASVYPDTVPIGSSGEYHNITVTIPMLTNMDYGDWTVKVGSSNCTNVTTSKNDNKLMLTCDIAKNTTSSTRTYTVTAASTKYGTYTATDALTFKKTIFNLTNMQDITSDICSDTTTPSASATLFDTDGTHFNNANYIPQTILTDTRDSKKYVIQKMPDGRCWMVQNIAIGPGTLQATKTNISTDYNLTALKTGSHTDGSVSSYGNYYNWYIATAGTGSSANNDGDVATGDICPKKWKLPDGGSNSDFVKLYNVYKDKAKLDAVWHPVYAGYYFNGSDFENVGTSGYWHTRTAMASSYSEAISVNSSYGTGGFTPKDLFSSIRCIAQQ